MTDIEDFTNQEQLSIRATLAKRWRKREVEVQIVDVDVRLDDLDENSISCPAFYWEYAEYHFLVMKTGVNKYRPQFFYQDTEEVAAETLEFDDVSECTMALLQLQANHALALREANGEAE